VEDIRCEWLVLDDDQFQLDLAQQALEGMGHDFHGFADGKTLLRALRRETFDLLILDWELPDISGIEVMRWPARTSRRRCPSCSSRTGAASRM